MKWARCDHENPAGVKFCEECGAQLESVCPACRASNPPTNKFCHECRAPLTGGPPAAKFTSPQSYIPRHLAEKILTSKSGLEGERKQVTVLFADLEGSPDRLAEQVERLTHHALRGMQFWPKKAEAELTAATLSGREIGR